MRVSILHFQSRPIFGIFTRLTAPRKKIEIKRMDTWTLSDIRMRRLVTQHYYYAAFEEHKTRCLQRHEHSLIALQRVPEVQWLLLSNLLSCLVLPPSFRLALPEKPLSRPLSQICVHARLNRRFSLAKIPPKSRILAAHRHLGVWFFRHNSGTRIRDSKRKDRNYRKAVGPSMDCGPITVMGTEYVYSRSCPPLIFWYQLIRILLRSFSPIRSNSVPSNSARRSTRTPLHRPRSGYFYQAVWQRRSSWLQYAFQLTWVG